MIYQGDCFNILPTLPAESVQCVVTSPPYWGLRDYGTATWEGGDSGCDHLAPKAGGTHPASAIQIRVKRVDFESGGQYRNICRKCGATRIDSQLGLESTPEAYVEKMVRVFREVRRVLRNDGTCWINLGNSYASGKGTCYNPGGGAKSYIQEKERFPLDRGNKSTLEASGLKPKDLVGIPWRVAFALQADGWYLRQDIIWAKPNTMPESVTDRCTKSHEYIFLLTKSARYFYDADAVKEPCHYPEGSWGRSKCYDGDDTGKLRSFYGNGSQWKGGENRNRRSVWTITTKPFKSVFSYGKYRIASSDCPVHDYHADLGRALECDALLASSQIDRMMNNGIHPFPLQEGIVVSIPLDHPSFPFDGISAIPHSMRNYRTADELKQDEIFFGISPFRTEYRELIDHSISKCVRTRGSNTEVDVFQGVSGTYPSGQTRYRIFCILTWQSPPSGCLCHYTGDLKKGQDHFAVFPPEIPEICIKAGSKVGDTVLDPFSGAGTTGLVAKKLGRKYIGIELNPSYVEMSEKRIESECGNLFRNKEY